MAPSTSPTVPGDENVGQPASGDPSGPKPTYEGQPTFSTGAEKIGDPELARQVVEAGNTGFAPPLDVDGDGDPDNRDGDPSAELTAEQQAEADAAAYAASQEASAAQASAEESNERNTP